MWRRYVRVVHAATKAAFARYPLAANCLSYGTISGGAEATQQLIDRHRRPQEVEGVDRRAIFRMFILGSLLLSPTLYFWYRFLDTRYPGAAWRPIFTKLLLDSTVASVPLYSAFYIGSSFLEGKKDVFGEWRSKFLPTYLVAMAFWIPMQCINFTFVSPERRVLFIAACTFVELNGLCLFKRMDENENH